MRIQNFSTKLIEVISYSKPLCNFFDKIVIIINPQAGGIKNRRKFKASYKTLCKGLENLKINYGKQNIDTQVYIPGSSKDNIQITEKIIKNNPDTKKLILIAAGDGTSKDICNTILQQKNKIIKKTTIFRLPLGTGNDNTDANEIKEIFEIFFKKLKIQKIRALKFCPKNLPVEFSFNAIGLGLDAFASDLTNKMKKYIPGRCYNIAVDITTLFYELIVRIKHMKININDKEYNEKILFILIGASGHRTIGSKKKILPDHNNICLTPSFNLFQKIFHKKKFYKGTHHKIKGVRLLSSDELIIDYPSIIPVQLDGDAYWLKPENFPVKIKVINSGIRIISK